MYLPKLFFVPDGVSGGEEPASGGESAVAEPESGGSNSNNGNSSEREKYLEAELKSAVKLREQAKQELAEATGKLQKLDDAEKLKRGEHEKIIAERDAEIMQLKQDLELKSQIAGKWEDFEKSEREAIKTELGEKYIDSFDKLEITDLRNIAGSLNPSFKPGIPPAEGTPKKPGKITLNEKQTEERDLMFGNIEDEERRSELYLDSVKERDERLKK